MITLILQVVVEIALIWFAIKTARTAKAFCLRFALVITALSAASMATVTAAQFSGIRFDWFQDAFRIFVLFLVASQITIIAALMEYTKWK